jgi:hypothetical protein
LTASISCHCVSCGSTACILPRYLLSWRLLHSAIILWPALLNTLPGSLLSLSDHSWLTASVRILLNRLMILPLSLIIALVVRLFIMLLFNIHVGVIIIVIIMMIVAITCHINCLAISVMMSWIVGLVIISVITAVMITIMRNQWIVVSVSDGLVNMAVMVKSQLKKPTVSVHQYIEVLMSMSVVTLNMCNFISMIIIV